MLLSFSFIVFSRSRSKIGVRLINRFINILIDNGVMYSPGKASNAGGVATSGLEMTQNYMGANWTSAEVDIKLHEIMKNIHQTCLAAAKEYGKPGNYLVGANIAGFLKVAKAMQAQGVV